MDETKKKLLAAQSVEEVAQVLKEAGDDEAKAERVWQEVCHLREQEGKDLSLDELEAVAGGVTNRNWLKEGCAATVEPGSDCWGTDGGCTFTNVYYTSKPCDQRCVFCGARYTVEHFSTGGLSNKPFVYYQCRECGKKAHYDKNSGQWEEYRY